MHCVISYVIYYKPIVYKFLLIKLRQKSEIFSTKPCIYCITPYIFILIAHYKPILYVNRLFKSLINKTVQIFRFVYVNVNCTRYKYFDLQV